MPSFLPRRTKTGPIPRDPPHHRICERLDIAHNVGKTSITFTVALGPFSSFCSLHYYHFETAFSSKTKRWTDHSPPKCCHALFITNQTVIYYIENEQYVHHHNAVQTEAFIVFHFPISDLYVPFFQCSVIYVLSEICVWYVALSCFKLLISFLSLSPQVRLVVYKLMDRTICSRKAGET